MTPYVLVMVTHSDFKQSKTLSKELVEKKLCACVNIIPSVTSIYQWQGKVCEEDEYLMLIKTHQSKVEALKKYITENHPYDVPECLVVSIQDGLPTYLDWVEKSLIG